MMFRPPRCAAPQVDQLTLQAEPFPTRYDFYKLFCWEVVLLMMFIAPAYFVLLSNFVYRAQFNS